MTRFEKEIKYRFSNIDIQNVKTCTWMINQNHKKCRIKYLYEIIIPVNGMRKYIWVYKVSFGYYVLNVAPVMIFFKNSEKFKIFQIINQTFINVKINLI